ncbi:MAG: TIGR03773 family transporter-associated surface protein [Corynebacterium sp.]|uniref:TIGR03773 family transporter-associated surface protein n=1 Tax=Corynebacterium sp. TaxID=1720 RepID=UPI0026E05F37|nr:TIGR03773 family transporter-associated surface protein [Corynebacterium sp.]MDO5671054.1 TIGR03773 family transporter-associated surface protein [Corynebacterium sp.]
MTTTGIRPPALLVLLLVIFGLAPPVQAQSFTLDHGHVDAFHVTASPGALHLDLKEDVTGSGVRHAPETVTLVVTDAAWSENTVAVPGIDKATYYLPQTQRSDLVWPGWDTQTVGTGGFGVINLTFHEVSGPGQVHLFETSGLGGISPVLTDGGLTLAGGSVITQSHPAHRHVNWAFTAPGKYRMVVTASGTDSSGATVTSNQATYTWTVGSGGTEAAQPAPATPAAPAAAPAAPAAQSAAPAECSPGITPLIKDDRSVPPVWRNPQELGFHLGDAAKKDLPVSVGPVPAGPVWMIGSTQEPGVPWLGANTQHPTMLENAAGDVTWELVSFAGPGPMVVYTQGGLGQVVGEEWFRGADGRAQGNHTIAPNSHVHPSWVFGAPGTYQVGIRQSTIKDGKTLAGTDILTFHVGESAGNARDGHFDLGGKLDPAGGDCGATPAVTGAPAQAETVRAAGQLPDTGASVMTLPFAVLGLGLLVFGAGVIRFVLAVTKAHR